MNPADAKKYKVAIGGHLYSFLSDEPEEVVLEATRMVDSLMGQTANTLPTIHVGQQAVLVAMKIALTAIQLKTAQQKTQLLATQLLQDVDSCLTIS